MKNPNIIPGQTDLTPEGEVVTALRELSPYRALFVSESFCPTPFVSYLYKITLPNTIELMNPYAYATYEEAALAEVDDSGRLRLDVSFFCPYCETLHVETFTYRENVQDLMTDIEDYRVICPSCDTHFMGIHHITLRDPACPGGYELPLWHGPVPEEMY